MRDVLLITVFETDFVLISMPYVVGFWLVLVGFGWFWLVWVGFGWVVFGGLEWSCASSPKNTLADRGMPECPMVVLVVLGGFGWFLWFWLVLVGFGGFGWFWLVLNGFDWFWWFWLVLVGFVWF